jgi:hypothetical protein
MSTTLNETRPRLERPAERETRILIPGVRWSFYETFVDALPEGSPVRLAYDGKVDLSPPQADRAGIYAAMCVAEVWTFDGATLTIRRLGADGRYHVVEKSSFLPLRADQVPRWLLDEDLSDYIAWMDRVSVWARKSLKKRKR